MSLSCRSLKEKTVLLLSCISAFIVISVLFLIIGEVLFTGLPSLSWYFITTSENATTHLGEGIANAILGTIMISLFATLIAAPFGIGTAIYMKRYAPDNPVTRAFRFLIEVLSGTPSIVVGIFGFLVFVYYMRSITGGFSLIAGCLALAILIMPVIERAVEDAITTVPYDLEEGSFALGADKWQTIRYITIPAAFTGILTSMSLGFGRAAEESAVVILTAGYTQYMPEFTIKNSDKLAVGIKIYPIQDQVATLPYAVYHAFQNSNVVKPSAGFAAAFVLIVIVFSINVIGKALLRSSIASGKSSSWLKMFREKVFSRAAPLRENNEGKPIESGSSDTISRMQEDANHPTNLKDRVAALLHRKDSKIQKKKDIQATTTESPVKSRAGYLARAILPFAIPALILLLIAFLTSIPPLHNRLGPVSPWLANIFGAGLAFIIIVAGLIFGLLLAKKSGTFRGKTRRIGYAGVGAGICLLMIAGIACATTAPGIFSTGNQTANAGSADRQAQLEKLIQQMDSKDSGGSSADVQGYSPSPGLVEQAGPVNPAQKPAVKDALSLGEYYSWGDDRHYSRATIYDYKVLPFYFWWWIDYNRFVQQVPAEGNTYLVVFIRIENTGTETSIVPSADMFNVTYRGNSYGRLPYLNQSVISTWQARQLEEESRREYYYQWIREIGQNKRDYAYLTGENLFKSGNSGNESTSTESDTASENAITANVTEYAGWYLKPGRSQAVDGYLLYEVPEDAAKHPDNVYVDVTFNSLSRAQWRLG